MYRGTIQRTQAKAADLFNSTIKSRSRKRKKKKKRIYPLMSPLKREENCGGGRLKIINVRSFK